MAIARISRIRKGEGAGGAIDPRRLQGELDLELQELAQLIKDYMIVTAEAGRSKFKRDQQGFVGKSEVSFDTDGVVIQVPEQAVYIDAGRKPGKRPPIIAIIGWLKRYKIKGRGKNGLFQSIKSTAYAIANHIAKFGIKSRPFLSKTLDFAAEMIAQSIDEILIPEIINTLDIAWSKKLNRNKCFL